MFGFLNPGFGRPGFFLWVLLTFNFFIAFKKHATHQFGF